MRVEGDVQQEPRRRRAQQVDAMAPEELAGEEPELLLLLLLLLFLRLRFRTLAAAAVGSSREQACLVFLATSAAYRAVSGILVRQ
jgi:hypothetical protein